MEKVKIHFKIGFNSDIIWCSNDIMIRTPTKKYVKEVGTPFYDNKKRTKYHKKIKHINAYQ